MSSDCARLALANPAPALDVWSASRGRPLESIAYGLWSALVPSLCKGFPTDQQRVQQYLCSCVDSPIIPRQALSSRTRSSFTCGCCCVKGERI
jgi:hypothetical protein